MHSKVLLVKKEDDLSNINLKKFINFHHLRIIFFINLVAKILLISNKIYFRIVYFKKSNRMNRTFLENTANFVIHLEKIR